MSKISKEGSKKIDPKNLPLVKALGEHCRKLRMESNYSIDRLAKENDSLNLSVIHRLETGSGAVTVNALFNFAQALKRHPKELFDFELPSDRRVLFTAAESTDLLFERGKSRLPVYSLPSAIRSFSMGETVAPEKTIEVKGIRRTHPSLFVTQAIGNSMHPEIKDGDLLVFHARPTEPLQGKIVLVHYRGPADTDTGGSFAIREYHSTKTISSDGTWAQGQIILNPFNPRYEPIVFLPESRENFKIVAEYLFTVKN